MRSRASLLAAAALGCGTTLEVHSLEVPAVLAKDCAQLSSDAERNACRSFNAPGGIVVNQRQRYRIAVEASSGVGLQVGSPGTLDGIDQQRLLVVGYTRQLFASGKLALALDDSQTVKTIGIQSEPGEIEAIQNLDALASARREVREAEEEKQAAKKKAKAAR